MRGGLILAIISIASIIALTASAASNENLCSDTDGGGDRSSATKSITTKGEVKYGLSSQHDTCLTSEDGVSTNSSQWLKEYFCDNDVRDSNVYNCIKLGFEKCSKGACTGTVSQGSATNTTQQSAQTTCGNKITEKIKGEECDPPGGICFGKTTAQYGTCQQDCKCKISTAAEKAPEICGDSVKDFGEDCEKDAECPQNFLCSSCKCVKQLTPEEIEAMKKTAKMQKENIDANITSEIDQKYNVSELPEVNLTATNFSEQPAIKATAGIAKFFKKIFVWLAGIFS